MSKINVNRLIKRWEKENPELQPKLAVIPKSEINQELTDQQIKNWREFLFHQIGVLALFMSKEQIKEFRNQAQAQIELIKAQ